MPGVLGLRKGLHKTPASQNKRGLLLCLCNRTVLWLSFTHSLCSLRSLCALRHRVSRFLLILSVLHVRIARCLTEFLVLFSSRSLLARCRWSGFSFCLAFVLRVPGFLLSLSCFVSVAPRHLSAVLFLPYFTVPHDVSVVLSLGSIAWRHARRRPGVQLHPRVHHRVRLDDGLRQLQLLLPQGMYYNRYGTRSGPSV